MDKVLSALKCVNCMDTLSTPVLLPCCHTICKSHTEVADEHIICAKCGSRHQNKGFILNEVVSDLISAQLSKFNFGTQHKETSKSCGELKKQLDKNDAMFTDLEYFVHESIDELKNRVLLRSEQLKVKIDEITQELIDELDDYERRCKINFEDINGTENFTSMLNGLKELSEKAKGSWKDWSTVLNELNVDFEKWSQIKIDCDSTLKNMCEKLKNFEREVFLKELDLKKLQIEFFENANIDPVLKRKIFFDSNILDSALFIEFVELCNSKININKLKLLYRGSRDGFGAVNFHSKCDNQANTVTVIKTTLGFIFGGYTQASWMSNGQCVNDTNAFLFSLVNPFKKTFLSKIIDSSTAIYNYSSFGPTFGNGHNIHICNNSNTTAGSYLNSPFSYQIPDGINDPNGVYFCENQNFMVNEIEVFQIENC